MGEHSWTTGSVPWMYQCVTEHMLGVRRTLGGLVIKPCMPSAWEEASVRRVYRGTTYDIRIANAGKKAGAAVAHITIDGAPHDPSQPLPVDGASHSVEVALKVPRVPMTIAANDPYMGAEGAPVRIIEYSDFQ